MANGGAQGQRRGEHVLRPRPSLTTAARPGIRPPGRGYPPTVGDERQPETERRTVRSDDPSLSPTANELLTRELREVVGAEEVDVPPDVPHRESEAHGGRPTLVATLDANRPIVLVTLLVALVVGGIVSLVTGQYWALLVAAGLHAIGTLAVAAGAIALTTRTEHVAPTVAARLEDEGVTDPDAVLSELVQEYGGSREARGVPEVVTSGHDERTAATEQDRAGAAVEQQTAMTPTSRGTEAGGEGSAIEALQWWITGAAAVVSIVVAAVVGGGMWALPAIVVPLCAGWLALQTWLARGGGVQRRSGDSTVARRALLPVGAFIVAGVLWFMLVIGWIGDLL